MTIATKKDDDYSKYLPPPIYTIDDNEALKLQTRVCSKHVKDLWKLQTGVSMWAQRSQGHQASRQCLMRKEKFDKRPDVRKNYEAPQSIHQTFLFRRQGLGNETNTTIRRPVLPVLSAEVPEFFPKVTNNGEDERHVSMPFFPAVAERHFPDELFPYHRGQFTNAVTIPQVIRLEFYFEVLQA